MGVENINALNKGIYKSSSLPKRIEKEVKQTFTEEAVTFEHDRRQKQEQHSQNLEDQAHEHLEEDADGVEDRTSRQETALDLTV